MSSPGSFAHGWRSLPPELTLMILSYALPSNIVLNLLNFNKSIYDSRLTSFYPDGVKVLRRNVPVAIPATKPSGFDTAVLPFLAVPEIATLALEVLYKHNTVDMSYEGSAHARIFMPPVAVRKYIRKLKYRLYLSVPAFQYMKSLFRDGANFENLSVVEIEVVGNLWAREEYVLSILESMDPVVIHTKVINAGVETTMEILTKIVVRS
jgi:hypothetical protein